MGDSVHVWIAPAGAEPRTAAHNLLITLAGSLVDSPALTHDPAGRPHISGLAVSISHTHHLVAVTASYDGPLGIDLEELHPRSIGPLAQRWFDPSELEWMAEQPDELTAFLHLWTAKEAVGKALGAGLRNSGLRRLMPVGGGVVESAPDVVVTYVPWEGAVLALAAPTGFVEIVVHYEAALRRVGRSRTSFPVVVRGS